MSDLEVKYVVMPITKEQKADLNKKGFRAIDARFAPKGEDVFDLNSEKKAKEPGVAEMRAALDAAGVEYATDAKKPEIAELYAALTKEGAE